MVELLLVLISAALIVACGAFVAAEFAFVTVDRSSVDKDADVEKGLISSSSPIGRAILNKEPGDEVVVTTPVGMRKFEITNLVTIHDD